MTENFASPTAETYRELEMAYDHFNRVLFESQLPPVLFTLQRKSNTMGYFSPDRFVRHDGQVRAEIAINPEYFALVPHLESMATILHESVHAWQFYFGTPSRRCYHNAEWAAKMESVGLMPSHTGRPGGRKTGQQMADYPIPGGRFMLACDELFTRDFKLSWADRFPTRQVLSMALENGGTAALAAQAGVSLGVRTDPPEAGGSHKAKFSCPGCKANAWGKPSLRIICEPCGYLMTGYEKPVGTQSLG